MKKLALLLVTFVLIGCGGGSGNSSANSPAPHVFTGIDNAASLDNAAAAGRFAFAILGVTETGSIGPARLSLENSEGIQIPQSVRAAVMHTAHKIVSPAGILGATSPRPAVYTQSFPGAEGGTMTMTVSTDVWVNNQTEFVTRMDVTFQSFDELVDGIANPINGSMSIVPDTWLGDGSPVYYVATFDMHVAMAPGEGGRITGSLDYHQVSATDMRHIYTWTNTLITDDRTGLQVWWNPLIEIDEDLFVDNRNLFAISGKVYVSDLGYATVSTLNPIDCPTGTGSIPISGKLLLTGVPGKAFVTVGVSPEVSVELDANGDGVFTAAEIYTWAGLAF